MEWFKCVDKFNENEKDLWNHDGSALVDLKSWKQRQIGVTSGFSI